ncbi:hypothetical protein F511_15252 [Dorcoceras hygrometricum]|uniref:Uncharacterized protein n=1 Tax=Dorcoceras hygrometricum TaxID=472368 RepID=A0A2Z7D759_9LAMI|nr:hypothetical protein F511_15252 [Dorcoceras hygrometricum]
MEIFSLPRGLMVDLRLKQGQFWCELVGSLALSWLTSLCWFRFLASWFLDTSLEISYPNRSGYYSPDTLFFRFLDIDCLELKGSRTEILVEELRELGFAILSSFEILFRLGFHCGNCSSEAKAVSILVVFRCCLIITRKLSAGLLEDDQLATVLLFSLLLWLLPLWDEWIATTFS